MTQDEQYYIEAIMPEVYGDFGYYITTVSRALEEYDCE